MKRLPYLLVLVAANAFAQTPPDQEPAKPEPPQPEETKPEEPKPDPNAERDAKIKELEERLQKVEEDLDQAKDDNSYLEEKLQSLLPVLNKFSGYVDLGAFATTGNGAGTRTDVGHVIFPQYSYV